MRVTILPSRGCYTDQGPQGRSQYYGQGVYCGLNTASEVFLIFTTRLYQLLRAFLSYAIK